MLYGKESPLLKTRTAKTSKNPLDKLISLKSMDSKRSMMSELEDTYSKEEEEEYEDEGSYANFPTSSNQGDPEPEGGHKIPKESDKCVEPGLVINCGEDLARKPRSIFRHLFDPNLLSNSKDVDTMLLEMQCAECYIKAPMTVMYHHAMDAHFLNLCIYCLGTFQNGRLLAIHLRREHRILPPHSTDFTQFNGIYKSSEVELFCTECNKQVVLTGNDDEDMASVLEHTCVVDEVMCTKCAKNYPLKEVASHMRACSGKSKSAESGGKVPMFNIKKESEVVDVSSTENPPAPQNQSELTRLRNRDSKCKTCDTLVSPSKLAQHAFDCVGPKVPKAKTEPPSLEKASNSSRRLVAKLPRPSPRRSLANKLDSVLDVNVNGSDVVADSQNLAENCADRLYLISPSHDHGDAAESPQVTTPGSSGQTDYIVAPSPSEEHSSLTSSGEVDQTFADSSLTTEETVDTKCDKDVLEERSLLETTDEHKFKHQDALLNEENPDKRRSILIAELCDLLEEQLNKELRHNDNIDIRTRSVDLFQPINELSSDEILESMISNACIGCTYCRQAKIVGVDRRQLVIHLLTRHTWDLKFHDSRDPINENTGDDTASEPSATLVNSTDSTQIKNLTIDWRQFRVTLLEKVFQLTNNIFNFPGREPFGECPCECLLCGCHIITQRLLFAHWNKLHPHTAMKCYMCHGNFLFVGALFSHLCFGTPDPLIKEVDPDPDGATLVNGGGEEGAQHNALNPDDDSTDMLRYQCGFCENRQLPGFFNYIVHLRTDHNLCELCLQPLVDQKELQNHILKKHRLNYYCWKCRIAYSDLTSYSSHMYWKHGNASVECNKCCEKKWSFAYHFCRPPMEFCCDICKERFLRSMSLRVHKRIHTGEKLRKCPKHNCHEKFISKKLLAKHIENVHDNPNSMIIANEEGEENEATEILVPETNHPVDVDETGDIYTLESSQNITAVDEVVNDDDIRPSTNESIADPLAPAVTETDSAFETTPVVTIDQSVTGDHPQSTDADAPSAGIDTSGKESPVTTITGDGENIFIPTFLDFAPSFDASRKYDKSLHIDALISGTKLVS